MWCHLIQWAIKSVWYHLIRAVQFGTELTIFVKFQWIFIQCFSERWHPQHNQMCPSALKMLFGNHNGKYFIEIIMEMHINNFHRISRCILNMFGMCYVFCPRTHKQNNKTIKQNKKQELKLANYQLLLCIQLRCDYFNSVIVYPCTQKQKQKITENP